MQRRLLLLAPLALACTGATDADPDVTPGARYTVQIEPVLPGNQQGLFAAANEVVLTLTETSGATEDLDLEPIEGGYAVGALPPLTDTRVGLVAYDLAGGVIGWGQTPPLTFEDGDEELFTMLFATPGEVARWDALDAPTWGGALVWDGAGRFLLFGGAEDGLVGRNSGRHDVWAMETGTPYATRSFTPVGTMPPLLGTDVEVKQGRFGLSATLLTGSHADQGKILVAGGSVDYDGLGDTGDDLFLWDPATDTAASIDGERMAGGLTMHDAAETPTGDVVLVGGFPDSGVNSAYVFGKRAFYYSAVDRTMDRVTVADSLATFPMSRAARLGNTGVVVCGGVDLLEVIEDEEGRQIDALFTLSAGCDLVTSGGELTPLDAAEDLPPERVLGADLVTLQDGRILMTGGLVPEDPDSFSINDVLDATVEAWLYDGELWQETRLPMSVPRAGHRTAVLPDGRVLIFGGVASQTGPFLDADDAVACVEVFYPDTRDFELLDEECDRTTSTSTLEAATAWPMVAVDPERGALFSGGLGDNNRPLSGNALFYAPPSL